jgi:hypothetical protein
MGVEFARLRRARFVTVLAGRQLAREPVFTPDGSVNKSTTPLGLHG